MNTALDLTGEIKHRIKEMLKESIRWFFNRKLPTLTPCSVRIRQSANPSRTARDSWQGKLMAPWVGDFASLLSSLQLEQKVANIFGPFRQKTKRTIRRRPNAHIAKISKKNDIPLLSSLGNTKMWCESHFLSNYFLILLSFSHYPFY